MGSRSISALAFFVLTSCQTTKLPTYGLSEEPEAPTEVICDQGEVVILRAILPTLDMSGHQRSIGAVERIFANGQRLSLPGGSLSTPESVGMELHGCLGSDDQYTVKSVWWQRYPGFSEIRRFSEAQILIVGDASRIAFGDNSVPVTLFAKDEFDDFGSAQTVVLDVREVSNGVSQTMAVIATVGSSEPIANDGRAFISFDRTSFAVAFEAGRSLSNIVCPSGFSPASRTLVRGSVQFDFETCAGQGIGNSYVATPVSVTVKDTSSHVPTDFQLPVRFDGPNISAIYSISNSHHNWCDRWAVTLPHATYRMQYSNLESSCSSPSCGSIFTINYNDGHVEEDRDGCLAVPE